MVGSGHQHRDGAQPAEAAGAKRRKLSKEERRRQLLATAARIVREEGVERLTLAHLAASAGVSKPVAYDHFGTRSGLLIALYKALDEAQAAQLQAALTAPGRSFEETVRVLADTFIHCSADTSGEWHAVGAALTGSAEMDAVYQELLDAYVRLFATVLAPHVALERDRLERRCVGLVGAGEALSAAMVRGHCGEADAADAFYALIVGGLSGAGPSAS